MNSPALKASEVEALTFIYTPSDPLESARRLAPRLGSGALGVAVGWVLLAGITWVRLATCGAPRRTPPACGRAGDAPAATRRRG